MTIDALYRSGDSPQNIPLGLLTLALFFVSYNTTLSFFLLSGAMNMPERPIIGVHFASSVGLSLLLPAGERFFHKPGWGGALVRGGLLALFLFPLLGCFFSPFLSLTEYAAVPLLIYLEFFFWGLFPPLAFHVFFRRARSGEQSFVFGLAACIGFAFGAMAMLSLPGADLPVSLPLVRLLSFLNFVRILTGLAFLMLAWRSLHLPPVDIILPRENFCRVKGEEAHAVGHFARTSLLYILLPLFISQCIGGLFDFQFSTWAQVYTYPEYTYFGLALLFLILGGAIFFWGESALRRLLAGAALCTALSSVLSFFPGVNQGEAAYLGMLSQKTLWFLSMYCCARCARFSAWPVLRLCLPWLSTLLALAGAAVSQNLLPALSLSPKPVIWFLASLSVVTAFLVRRGFPLPELPAEDTNSEALVAMELPADKCDQAAVGVEEFAERYRLSRREKQIVEQLLHGRTTEAMAAALGLRESSVRRYVNSVLQKTGAGSRLGLVTVLMFGEEKAPECAIQKKLRGSLTSS